MIGGGNAGLCAALTARRAGASVTVLEGAPRHFRGGNSRHTRNFRCAHAAPTEWPTEAYSEEEFLADLNRVTDSLPLGIVVNRHGDRFHDEGEDAWPKRYAITRSVTIWSAISTRKRRRVFG